MHEWAKMCAGVKYQARGAPAKNAILWTLLFTPHAQHDKLCATRLSCLLYGGGTEWEQEPLGY